MGKRSRDVQQDEEDLNVSEHESLDKINKSEKKSKKEKSEKKKKSKKEKPIEDDSDSHAKKSKKSKKEKNPVIEEDEESGASEGELENYTAYVGGIPYEATVDELWNIFGTCGNIVDIRMARWNDSGKCRGYAHVDFESEKDLKKAVKDLDKYQMGARYLSVTVANAKSAVTPKTDPAKIPDTCNTIFVKNLPYDTDEDSVKEAFASFGKVTDVRLPRWHHTGRLKGNGYVQFATPASVRSILSEKSPIFVCDRKVIVDADVGGAPKSSFRDSSGRQWNKTVGRSIKKDSSRETKSTNRGRSGQGRSRK